MCSIKYIYLVAEKKDFFSFAIRISVRAGTGFSDLQEVEVIELNEPNGWVAVPLKDAQDK